MATETYRRTLRTQPIVLAGPAVYEPLMAAQSTTTLRLALITYDEASSADAGVAVRIGKIGSASYFATYTTEVSKAAGSVVNLPQITNTLAPGETLTVECDGNKTGAGTISVQIECHYSLIQS